MSVDVLSGARPNPGQGGNRVHRARPGVRLVGALLFAAIVAPTQAGCGTAKAVVPLGGCHLVEGPVYGHQRTVCLLRQQAGRGRGETPEFAVEFTYVSVQWRYRCARTVPRTSFWVFLDERTRTGEDNGPDVLSTNRRSGAGLVRNIMGKGRHVIGFVMAAGSYDPSLHIISFKPEPCTWHITVTGDNYNRT